MLPFFSCKILLKRQVVFYGANIRIITKIGCRYVNISGILGFPLSMMWHVAVFFTLVQHHHIIAYNFGTKPAVFVFIFPTAGAQAALNEYQAAFMKEFLCQLSQSTPKWR